MQKIHKLVLLVMLGVLVLSACGGSGSDLDGREVTIAIENAYLPFNYVDAETGEHTKYYCTATANRPGRNLSA